MKKGKLLFTATVSCGKCREGCEILTGAGHTSGSSLLKDLYQEGWKKTKKYGWVCPDHGKKSQ